MEFDVARAVRAIEERSVVGRPTLVAIDGRSGVGKSTFAKRLARLRETAIIEGDDFYAGGVGLRTDSPAERAESCIDWRRQRSHRQSPST
jgi:uridine kinase